KFYRRIFAGFGTDRESGIGHDNLQGYRTQKRAFPGHISPCNDKEFFSLNTVIVFYRFCGIDQGMHGPGSPEDIFSRSNIGKNIARVVKCKISEGIKSIRKVNNFKPVLHFIPISSYPFFQLIRLVQVPQQKTVAYSSENK